MTFSSFDGLKITQKIEWFERNTNGKWNKKPYKTDTETITAEQYKMIVKNRMGIERQYSTYSYCGYHPYKIVSIEPTYQNSKITRTFTFLIERKEK